MSDDTDGSDDCNEPEPSKWGKGKTDPATWWEKGCKSPNPAGRPKGAKSQKTKYLEAFDKRRLKVDLDGEEKTVTFGQLGYHQLAQKAGGGDLKAIAMQLQLDEKFDVPETPVPTPEESAIDFATLESWGELREKFLAFKKSGDGGG